MRSLFLSILCLILAVVMAQAQVLEGHITAGGKPVKEGQVVNLLDALHPGVADSAGHYRLALPAGAQTVVAVALGYASMKRTVEMPAVGTVRMDFALQPLEATLEAVTVEAQRLRGFGIRQLGKVEDFGLYEAKKSEVIVLKNLTVNQATNNARQIYARVPGLNVWESDQAGLQLGIGGRGLSPNRTSNFNTRQNGYDISADALGYPESYYTPPPEATEQIEIVRGAAALQYGTQFGGMLNFKLKEPDPKRRLGITLRQSGGSWGFSNSHVDATGTTADGKLGYTAFYQHKQSDGWRPNSNFAYDMARAYLRYKPTARLAVSVEYSFMHYLARQPGGLDDRHFAQDARQSLRNRNWFQVNWNLLAVTGEYKISDKTRANVRVFGLVARRQALGNLQPPNVVDFDSTNRNLLDGRYRNLGVEGRVVHEGRLLGKEATLLAGVRVYEGFATQQQGDADPGKGPTFKFVDTQPSGSDYRFPNHNQALFAEAAWALTDLLSVVPGLRYEYILTQSIGRYTLRVKDLAGNIVSQTTRPEHQVRGRSKLLAGLGASYKGQSGKWEMYANGCRNYRALNFNDIRIDNPSLRIDSTIHDEQGFSVDAGLRSRGVHAFRYDVSAFWVEYNDRIGTTLRSDNFRYRANIGDARMLGLEAYGELDIARALRIAHSADTVTNAWQVAVFTSFGYTHARYTRTKEGLVKVGNEVEQVPPYILRGGLTVGRRLWQASLQASHTARQYSDATNSDPKLTSNGLVGLIPAYTVLDLTASYQVMRHLRLEASCNNLLDARYFTRRADSYPGPGIIPADARSFYGTVVVTL